jgi:hypothetical protein
MMNIVETKKIEQIDSIGRWSQESIMTICARIVMASNEIQQYENVCGDQLDVGSDLFTVLNTAGGMYAPVPKVDQGLLPFEGVLNGVIKVYLKYDLEPNSAVIYHGDTGIKLIFDGLELTTEGITFEKE